MMAQELRNVSVGVKGQISHIIDKKLFYKMFVYKMTRRIIIWS